MFIKTVLPEEMLLEIFSESDNSDLKTLLKLSVEWRNLLIKNAKIMRKLPLILLNETWKEKMKFVQNYGKYIRDVIFCKTSINSLEDVIEVLKLTPNIERLSLIDLKIPEMSQDDNDDEKCVMDILNLQHLIEVEVKGDTNFGAFDFLETRLKMKLKILKCELNCDSQLDRFEKFLISVQNLRSLEISSQSDVNLCSSEDTLKKFQFNLDKLTIRMPIIRFSDQFANFLSSQGKLNEINFDGNHVDFRYYQMMLDPESSSSVKKIVFNIDAIACSDSLTALHKIKPNTNIEILSLTGKNIHLNIFDAILRLCPKIKQLQIESMTQFHSDKIMMTLTQLEDLKVDKIDSEFLCFIIAIKLKKLQIGDIINAGNYEKNLQYYQNCYAFKNVLDTTNKFNKL